MRSITLYALNICFISHTVYKIFTLVELSNCLYVNIVWPAAT